MEKHDEILLKIKERPSLYLGKKSLTLLHVFLGGYDTCYYDYFEKTAKTSFDGFEEFIRAKYNASKSYFNWAGNILNNTKTEEEAFDKFFELYDEFLSQKS